VYSYFFPNLFMVTLTNTTPAHTVGPWTLAPNDSGFIRDGRKNIGVAQVNAGVAEWEANARLIAMAPEMLGKLKDCANELELVWRSLGQKRSNSFVDEARKIIAKAEGRSLSA
jgi:hypothetical protein